MSGQFGTVLGESTIPLVTEKHAELLLDRQVPIELEAALIEFVRGWWSYPPRVAAMFTVAHERRNAAIIEEHRQLALAQEKTSRPLRTTGSTGTRRAHGKRKRKHGR